MPLTISSPALTDGGAVPARFTCDGDQVAPPIMWSQVPPGTRSLVLVVHDPDAPDPAAPKRDFTHWVVYDLPPAAERIAEDATRGALPDPAREGKNDEGSTGYTGPCPPVGRHRYFFRLSALDAMLGDLGAPTRQEVERAMEGHVLETAELVATYERPGGSG